MFKQTALTCVIVLTVLSVSKISNQPPAGPPAPSKPEYKARLLRASPRRCADGLRIIEAQVTSPHTHTRGTHRGHPRVPSRICHTQSITLTTHGDRVERGGGGGSGTRGRTDSDGAKQRPPGRPLLCLPERAVCAQLERGQVHREAWRRGETRRLERCQVHREAWRRGETRRRWRAGERPARGEADR